MINLLTRTRKLRETRNETLQFIFRNFATRWRKTSHYDVLGVETTASKKEIRNAYITQSKVCHPDNDPTDASLHNKFLAIQEAFDVLSSDQKRREYDLKRRNQRPHPPPPPHHPGPTSRSWTGDDAGAEAGTAEKNRAFWTDPEYRRQFGGPPSRSIRLFGREYSRNDANGLILAMVLSWITCGTIFVIVYVKYFRGPRVRTIVEQEWEKEFEAARREAKSRMKKESVDSMTKRSTPEKRLEKVDDTNVSVTYEDVVANDRNSISTNDDQI